MADDTSKGSGRRGKTHKDRVPFGGFQAKLEVANKDPNYHYYWQKDVGDNLRNMLRAGYEFVTEKEAGRVDPELLTYKDVHGGNQSLTDQYRVVGGRDEFGRQYDLVLMRQPMEYYLQDRAAKDKRADEIDQSIRRQAFDGDKGDAGARYGDINVTVKHEE